MSPRRSLCRRAARLPRAHQDPLDHVRLERELTREELEHIALFVLHLALRALWRATGQAAPVLRHIEAQLRPSADMARIDRCDPWVLPLAVEMGPAAAPLRAALERYARIDADTREAAQAVLRALATGAR